MALALCVCLGTLFWCILLSRRQNSGVDRVLTLILGIIAIYQALEILKDSGIIQFPGIHKLEGWVDFIVAGTYMIAAVFLKFSSTDRASTKVRLRLVEANEKTMDPFKGSAGADSAAPIFDASPLAAFAVDGGGSVLYWNPAAEALFGWKREELVGQRLPFAESGPFRNKRGQEVEAACWRAPLRASAGPRGGTLTIAADRVALREAGLEAEVSPENRELVAES